MEHLALENSCVLSYLTGLTSVNNKIELELGLRKLINLVNNVRMSSIYLSP